jgi:hypothetical protein
MVFKSRAKIISTCPCNFTYYKTVGKLHDNIVIRNTSVIVLNKMTCQVKSPFASHILELKTHQCKPSQFARRLLKNYHQFGLIVTHA